MIDARGQSSVRAENPDNQRVAGPPGAKEMEAFIEAAHKCVFCSVGR